MWDDATKRDMAEQGITDRKNYVLNMPPDTSMWFERADSAMRQSMWETENKLKVLGRKEKKSDNQHNMVEVLTDLF